MKQILLIITILIIQITGYSQEFSGNSAGWNNDLAVQSEKNQAELKIFPNPCKNKKVTLEFNTDLLSEIRLINIIGKEIFIKRLEIPVNRIQLELNDVPNGIYMVQVKTSDDRIVVKKLLVTGS
jgi:hypothetical protein